MAVSTKGAITTSLLLCFLACVYATPISSDWTDCSVTCGGGTRTKLRDGTTVVDNCNVQECSPFTPWRYSHCFDYSCTGPTHVVESRDCPTGETCSGPMVRLLFNTCPTCTNGFQSRVSRHG